jgi:hypothetical protein
VRKPPSYPTTQGVPGPDAYGNGVLSTFIQERPFYTVRDVSVLTNKLALSKAELLYYCVCIRSNRYRYSYGRQANRTPRDIPLPKPTDIPSWVVDAAAIDYAGKDAPADSRATLDLNVADWRPIKLGEIFEIKGGQGLPKYARRSGKTPYIGALAQNNGLVGHVAQKAMHPANTLTLNWNGVGGVGFAFYQPTGYWCSGDVKALYPRFAMTPAIAMFLIAIIRGERYRYGFGRKWALERMLTSEIRLPSKSHDTPDWVFMDRYINTLPYSSQL